MESIGKSLGRILKQYRFQHNKSQNELAEMLDLARITITKWENKGAGTATLDQVVDISRRLNLPVEKLLSMNEPQTEKVELSKSDWQAIQKAHLIPERLLTQLSHLSETKRRVILEMLEDQIQGALEMEDKESSSG